MWETASGTKNVGVRWYYHLAEVECSNASERQKLGRIKRPKVYCVFNLNYALTLKLNPSLLSGFSKRIIPMFVLV